MDQPTGNRISKTVTAPSTTIKDVYALGHLSEQTDSSGNPLATFTYENSGRPASVVLGNPSTGNRYYYVYNGHGDVVALTDSSGTVVASYSYDAFGALLSSSENFGGWSNPYRYDGADLVRYDTETGLYWMSVRAYDPTLGRFISHDPLGRLAAEGIDFAPYVYAGNNPLNRVDPSGQRWVDDSGDSAWISGGSVYVQTPGARPTVVAKVPVRTPAPTKTAPTCSGGGGTRASAHVCVNTTAPAQPATTGSSGGKDLCDGPTKQMCTASDDAWEANGSFGLLATKLGALAVIGQSAAFVLEMLAGAALAIPIVGEVLGGILSGAAAVVQSLALSSALGVILAGGVASLFAIQAGKHTEADWSQASLANLKSELDNLITVGGLVIGAIVALNTLVKGLITTGIGKVLGSTEPLLLGAINGAAADYGGFRINDMRGAADYWMGRMNNDMGYS
ncbi:MAG: RHS repeat-associated core domain-containing protein [Ktedonobacteraceae bacterium]